MAEPFLNWLGNKKTALSLLKKELPQNYNKYYEPFIGSGVIFLDLEYKNSLISDINIELINTYQIIQKKPHELIEYLNKFENNKIFFNRIANFDQREDYYKINKVFKAARFIYLNHTSYNNFYRISKDGFYSGSFNQKNSFDKFNMNLLYQASRVLENVEIKHQHYSNILDQIQEGDFIYLDPPYDDIKSFKYNENIFSRLNQLELREFIDEINNKKAFFILSNSNTHYIKDLYQRFNIIEISLPNRIELIIKNF